MVLQQRTRGRNSRPRISAESGRRRSLHRARRRRHRAPCGWRSRPARASTRGGSGLYADGQLLYVQQGWLVAQRVDLSAKSLIGQPVNLVEGVAHELVPGPSARVTPRILTAVVGTTESVPSGGIGAGGVLRPPRRSPQAPGPPATCSAAACSRRRSSTTRRRRTLMSGRSTSRPAPGSACLQVDVATGKVTPFLTTNANETYASFSPDGRSVVYVTDASGTAEVFVQPIPRGDARRISASGGTLPRWSRDGRSLFFLAPDGWLMEVAMGGSTATSAAAPERVVRAEGFDFIPSDDGQRFLVFDRDRRHGRSPSSTGSRSCRATDGRHSGLATLLHLPAGKQRCTIVPVVAGAVPPCVRCGFEPQPLRSEATPLAACA